MLHWRAGITLHQPFMIDLSDRITVFVLTVGDQPNFADCMVHLERQSVRFRLEILDHVAPFSAAMQATVDRCRTPLYIPVDEDMLLFPHAVQTLDESMELSGAQTALFCAPLWDCDIASSVYGVKIFRHGIVRRFPYPDTFSSDTEQVRRLRCAGWNAIDLPLGDRDTCLGEHGKHYTPRTIYLRWRRLFQKRHLYGPHRGRGIPGPDFFLERFLRDPQPLHLYSLLGVVAGLIGAPPEDREFDFRDPCPEVDRFIEAFGNTIRPK